MLYPVLIDTQNLNYSQRWFLPRVFLFFLDPNPSGRHMFSSKVSAFLVPYSGIIFHALGLGIRRKRCDNKTANRRCSERTASVVHHQQYNVQD